MGRSRNLGGKVIFLGKLLRSCVKIPVSVKNYVQFTRDAGKVSQL
jgi:hypothetical protein